MLPTRRLERKFFGNLQKLIMLKGYFNFLLTVSFVQYLTRNDAYSLNAHIFQFDYFIFFFFLKKITPGFAYPHSSSSFLRKPFTK